MNRWFKYIVCGVMAAAVMQSTGCALLPQEEVLPDAPVKREDTAAEFTLTYAARGDLVNNQRFEVEYRAVRQEQLCFGINGIPIEEVYVAAGDTVKAGQVLMELEQNQLKEQADSARARCDTLELQLKQAKENRELSRDEYALQLKYMDEEELEEAKTMEEYLRDQERNISSIEDQLTLAQKEVRLLENDAEQRLLRAGIDGIVTYVRTIKPNYVSSNSETMVVLSDSSSSMFVVETKDTQYFEVGMEVDIIIGTNHYPCHVISAEEAGASGEDEVYFKCDLPTAELSDGESGYLMMELERYDDVLYIQQECVKTLGDQEFVYVQDENGLRSTVEVHTGVALNGFVEVLDGLNEGDAVILR